MFTLKGKVLMWSATTTIVIATLLAMFGTGDVQAKTAKCYFSVNRVVYIDGACEFERDGSEGSFTFSDGKLITRCATHDLGRGKCSMASTLVVRKGTFGKLIVTSPGKAVIAWNRGKELHAHEMISTVSRSGACWQNVNARLCAW